MTQSTKYELMKRRVQRMSSLQITKRIESKGFTVDELEFAISVLQARGVDTKKYIIHKCNDNIRPSTSVLDEEEEEYTLNEDKVNEVVGAMDPVIEENNTGKLKRIMFIIGEKNYCELTEKEANDIISICREENLVVEKKIEKKPVIVKKEKRQENSLKPKAGFKAAKQKLPKEGSKSREIYDLFIENEGISIREVATRIGTRYLFAYNIKQRYLAHLNA